MIRSKMLIASLIALAIVAVTVLFAVPIHGAPAATVLADLRFDDRMLAVGFGGLVLNRATLGALFTGFKKSFMTGFDGAPSDWQQIAMHVPSSTSQEVYPWLGQTTRFREWLGDRVIQNLATHDFTIKNKTFENTVSVPREAIEDDTFGIYKPMIQQLGQDAKQHPDELVWGLLQQGFSQTCFDGQYFFDTDHPVLQGDGSVASVSNFAGGAGAAWYLLDTTRVVRPIIYQERKPYNFVALDKEDDENVFFRKDYVYGVDARSNVGFGLWQLAHASKQDLTAENFNAVYAAMQGLKGDNGKPLGIRPKLLVVPPSLRAAALEVVKAERNAAGATNINRDVVDVLSTAWLA